MGPPIRSLGRAPPWTIDSSCMCGDFVGGDDCGDELVTAPRAEPWADGMGPCEWKAFGL